jgi:hypothetical protein
MKGNYFVCASSSDVRTWKYDELRPELGRQSARIRKGWSWVLARSSDHGQRGLKLQSCCDRRWELLDKKVKVRMNSHKQTFIFEVMTSVNSTRPTSSVNLHTQSSWFDKIHQSRFNQVLLSNIFNSFHHLAEVQPPLSFLSSIPVSSTIFLQN